MKKTAPTRSVITVLIMVMCLNFSYVTGSTAAGPETVNKQSAYSTNGMVPKGGKKVSKKEFLNLLSRGEGFLNYPSKTQIENVAIEKSNKENENYIRQMAKLYPTLKRFLKLYEPKAPELVDKEGNFSSPIEYNNKEKSEVILMGKNFIYRSLASSIRSMRSRTEQAAMYRRLYDLLPSEFFKQYPGGIISPDIVAKQALAIIARRNRELAERVAMFIASMRATGVLPPENRPGNCRGEFGSGDGTDRAINRGMGIDYEIDEQGAHDPEGLFAKQNFPMKWKATCTKNQGPRGLCTVFAAMGALETGVAIKEDRWINLSENYAWAHNRLNQYRSRSPGTANIDLLAELQTRIPYENGWDYNPSYFKCSGSGDNSCPQGRRYKNVCVNYSGEHCSETKHQADWVYHCGANGECHLAWTIGATAAAEHKIKQVFSIWTVDRSSTFNNAVSWTMVPPAVRPMYMDTLVKNNGFQSRGECVNEAGYLIYDAECKAELQALRDEGRIGIPGGAHAMQVVAAIPNSALAEGVPRAANDGWYVVKNSWGSRRDDQGWLYLPSDWVADYATGLKVLFDFQ